MDTSDEVSYATGVEKAMLAELRSAGAVYVASHSPDPFALDDVASLILSYLTNPDLEKLFISGLVPRLSSLVSSQMFWHARVETFSTLRTPFSLDVEWRETYQLLIESNDLYNKEDNVVATDVLYRMGFRSVLLTMAKAARYGQSKILAYLLAEGSVHPDKPVSISRDEYGEPLILAIQGDHPDIVSLLLADPRVDPTNGTGYNHILMSVCRLQRREILQLLVDDGRTSNKDYKRAMTEIATYSDNAEMVRILLSRVGPDDADLYLAVCMGRERIVALLLEDGRADPGYEDSEILCSAISCGHVGILSMLLTDGRVDPSARDNRALDLALRSAEHQIELANILLRDERVRELFYQSDLANSSSLMTLLTVQPRKS